MAEVHEELVHHPAKFRVKKEVIPHAPHVIRDPRSHRGRHAERLVNTTEYDGPEVITVPSPVAAEVESGKTTAPAKAPVRSYSFALSPDSNVDLVFHGEITDDSLKALRDYVDITVRVLGGLKGEPNSREAGHQEGTQI